MKLFDSHAHYNDERFELDVKEGLLEEIHKAGIEKIVNVGYNVEMSRKAIEIANNYEFVYASVGISPNDLEEENLNFEEIRNLAKNKKVVAIGEIGLDYYWNKENKELQKSTFIKQIEIANELDLPIIIHTREAANDTIDILKNNIECKNKGVLHCCPLNREIVREALNLGYYISFAGPVTFKNSKNANEVIEMVPEEKILIETDSPYLSPEPFRGKRNDSRNVQYIAEKVANVKGISIEKIAEITYNNAKKIFKL